MSAPYAVIAVALGAAVLVRVRRRARAKGAAPLRLPRPVRFDDRLHGVVALVAWRDLRERARSRIFRVGTAVIVLGVAAGIVIPAELHNGGPTTATVGTLGPVTALQRASIVAAASSEGYTARIVAEPTLAATDAALRTGQIDVALVDGRRLLVEEGITASDTSTAASLAPTLSSSLGLERSLEQAGVPVDRVGAVLRGARLPVSSLRAAPPQKKSHFSGTVVVGLILIYVLISQYATWVLMGVMEEKSSRVVEVLLSTIRPVQLLAGKVIGIGTAALAQAALLLAVALGLAAAVGSSVLKGTGLWEILAVLIWLLLGYSLYSWVYAAAGSMAERQEQVQTLAFPLQLPLLLGYIASLTSQGSPTPSLFVHVLAYIPLTAPFAMPTLVADGVATWWEFLISVALAVVGIIVVMRAATAVYRRAVLRTGRRVRLREVMSD